MQSSKVLSPVTENGTIMNVSQDERDLGGRKQYYKTAGRTWIGGELLTVFHLLICVIVHHGTFSMAFIRTTFVVSLPFLREITARLGLEGIFPDRRVHAPCHGGAAGRAGV